MEDMQHKHRMQDSKHSMYGRFVLMAVDDVHRHVLFDVCDDRQAGKSFEYQ
jgi:hypothetical protein